MKPNSNLYLYYGPMFSGKSKKLIEVYNSLKLEKIIFKPKIDTRSKNFVISREGGKIEAISIQKIEDIYSYLENIDIKDIFFDEMFMLEGNINNVVDDLLLKNYRIHIASLDKNYLGNEFIEIKKLIKKTPEYNKHKLFGRCHICNMPSNWTVRLVDGYLDSDKSPEIIVDDDNKKVIYETRCDNHKFTEKILEQEKIYKDSEAIYN
ncbi:/ tdk / Thymidine kinase /:121477 Forward [Candidatus Hepatoplasma crinochetorum]|uniref:Thymidine kinase n=1 Tax=Candidatus Hepatoplasma crinochetorum TaxID=295596 RepID=A0A0G7ZNN1_9MOLU|nr:/ tdk / Thymidine kinase /:121477 Forward [Candidatus Hepatoplasma crinochetorum]